MCQDCNWGASEELIRRMSSPGPPALTANPCRLHSLQAAREAGRLPLSPGGAFTPAPARRWLSSAKDAVKNNVKLPRRLSTHEP